ncbi:TonB family protein [Dyadobacter sp. LHD-138]|uniref:energy transducer TonB n=1 Tax=Dyadobacter sp. LHD-138 TaxID=3071413 RepID=UPI0027DEDD68|nr:TonB family protein [Dyadobacter sp. LHD-138]MDQ6480396.1 TonB family protein [Dyadobacter sp. LHD-138]
MKRMLLVFILLSYQAISQTVYQPHEVEIQAVPSGGAAMLNQFLASNVQIPFKSGIQGLNKKVFVKGVVEPDGSVTGLEIVKGQDSLSNIEALRAFGLYTSWQPATIKDQKVRQAVIYQIHFNAAALENFDSTSWSFVNYYDKKYQPTNIPKDYEYRSVMPVNEQGYIRGDIVYEELRAGHWRKVNTVPFQRKELWHKVYGEPGVDSVKVYQLLAEDRNENNFVPVLTFQDNGKLISYKEYNASNRLGLKKEYYLSGMLREVETTQDTTVTKVSWYKNGQVRSAVEYPVNKPLAVFDGKVLGAWEFNGKQTVKDGNGWWKYSVNDANRLLHEEGAVNQGAKTGKWIGKWSDSTLYYVESYDNGVLKDAHCFVNGEKITYSVKGTQAQFKGGLNGLYQFLGQNLRYPADAARKGITGRVRLSFTVCEDGSLCDYKVEKGLVPDMDEEALRVVKKMSGKWEPGQLRGQKVRILYNLPINFMQQ